MARVPVCGQRLGVQGLTARDWHSRVHARLRLVAGRDGAWVRDATHAWSAYKRRATGAAETELRETQAPSMIEGQSTGRESCRVNQRTEETKCTEQARAERRVSDAPPQPPLPQLDAKVAKQVTRQVSVLAFVQVACHSTASTAGHDPDEHKHAHTPSRRLTAVCLESACGDTRRERERAIGRYLGRAVPGKDCLRRAAPPEAVRWWRGAHGLSGVHVRLTRRSMVLSCFFVRGWNRPNRRVRSASPLLRHAQPRRRSAHPVRQPQRPGGAGRQQTKTKRVVRRPDLALRRVRVREIRPRRLSRWWVLATPAAHCSSRHATRYDVRRLPVRCRRRRRSHRHRHHP